MGVTLNGLGITYHNYRMRSGLMGGIGDERLSGRNGGRLIAA